MYDLWKANSIVFALQAIVGGGVYWQTGNIILCVIALGLLSLGIFYFAPEVFGVQAIYMFIFGVLAALDIYDFALLAIAISMGLALTAEEVKDESSFWHRLVCTIPLGIGTIFGGVLLWQRYKSTEAVK